jgi:hypothetical protein
MLTTTVLLLLAAAGTSQQVPIPPRYDGFSIGANKNAPIQFEVFYDLMCPDSRRSWPTIKQVVAHYDDNLNFILHRFPLPYHHNSYYSNWMAGVVNRVGTPSVPEIGVGAVWKWVDAIFEAQDSFGNAFTINQTAAQVKDRMSQLAQSCCGISNLTALDAAFSYHSPEEEATRVSWKFGSGSRAISGTPSFQVNGVTVLDADPSWTLSDWMTFLDPLLGSRR